MFLYFSSFLIVIVIAFQGNFCCLMHRSIPKPPIYPPPPQANPLAFNCFEKFWSNDPPVRASKRVKSPTLQGKQNRLPLEINRIATHVLLFPTG